MAAICRLFQKSQCVSHNPDPLPAERLSVSQRLEQVECLSSPRVLRAGVYCSSHCCGVRQIGPRRPRGLFRKASVPHTAADCGGSPSHGLEGSTDRRAETDRAVSTLDSLLPPPPTGGGGKSVHWRPPTTPSSSSSSSFSLSSCGMPLAPPPRF